MCALAEHVDLERLILTGHWARLRAVLLKADDQPNDETEDAKPKQVLLLVQASTVTSALRVRLLHLPQQLLHCLLHWLMRLSQQGLLALTI